MWALFFAALAMGNHLTIILLFPAFIYMILITARFKPGQLRLKSSFGYILPPIIGIGIVVLLYYILDATASPYDHLRAIEMMSPESWGKTAADFHTFWQRMFHLLTARQFSGSMFNIGWDEMMTRVVKSFSFALDNLGLVGMIAALAGFAAMAASLRRIAIFFAILALTVLIYDLNYGIWQFDIEI